eukprot:TRINITY_DN19934_c0_g1_i1.p1 TRINITY_DN19934_c0_g1~~TRINITY_DN19934_c0_g1_i1.p1  ORF type:complete len:504 (-),score=60.38 TRINITY_DN19934_c0_g1_i1:810-2321(-)
MPHSPHSVPHAVPTPSETLSDDESASAGGDSSFALESTLTTCGSVPSAVTPWSRMRRSATHDMFRGEDDVDDSRLDMSETTADAGERKQVYRIVLTGGPCGGKTTSLTTVAERLRSLGTQVFVVPENATLFVNGGAAFPVHATKSHQMCWESSRIMCQMQMEDSFIQIARAAHRPTVLLCDRGTMDAAAYMDTQTWHELLAEMNWETDILREERYDAVIHLVSTAIGAEEYYTTMNNDARRESLSEAAEIDNKIRAVWRGHPHVEIIDNSTDFERKVVRVVKSICRILNMRAPTSNGLFQIFSIDLRARDRISALLVHYEEFLVKTHFLKGATETDNQHIRQLEQKNPHGTALTLYTFASRRLLSNGQFAVEERAITSKEFYTLLKRSDISLRRLRRTFLWQDQYFQLDEYEDVMLLSVEVETKEDTVNVPPWLAGFVLANVTDDEQYRIFNIAQRYTCQPQKPGPELSLLQTHLQSKFRLRDVDSEERSTHTERSALELHEE